MQEWWCLAGQESIFTPLPIFGDSCEECELPKNFASRQIKVFLETLDMKNYASSTVEAHWCSLKYVSKLLGKEPTPEQELHYNYVRKNCQELRDSKLPVTRMLLLQLVAAADLVLSNHNTLLAQTIFLCAWAFSLRVCEFTTWHSQAVIPKDHNLCSNSIRMSDVSLSAAFVSDKTAKYTRAIKHWLVKWKKLLLETCQIVELYK